MKEARRVKLPLNASNLTAHPEDDFESESDWLELATVETSSDVAAFWHVISTFTNRQHWNRTIFEVSLESQQLLINGSVHGDDVDHNLDDFVGPPPSGMRYIALRELARKTAAPIGGGTDGNSPTYTAKEWTAQYVHQRSTDGTLVHTAIFGLVVPNTVCGPDNPRGMKYWPFQYPKVRCYKYTYEETSAFVQNEENSSTANDLALCNNDDGESEQSNIASANLNSEEVNAFDSCSSVKKRKGLLRYSIVPLGKEVNERRDFDAIKRHAKNSAEKQLTRLRKRAEYYDSSLGISTYIKRVVHDRIVPERVYRDHYNRLRQRYSYWVDIWKECTDPVKFVYEEMSIAAYLCALWELEQEADGLKSKQTFIDCGCGNGFLVYLLRSEGYEGIGVDLQRRRIWDEYPDYITASLHHEPIDPMTYNCSGYDWIIGNHSDELTPWLPAMAARAQKAEQQRDLCVNVNLGGEQRDIRRASPQIFVLPCCFFDFDGRKLNFGNTRRTIGVPNSACDGKYAQYILWIEKIATAFGFHVERENLRIPSTKYKCIIGRSILHEERIQPKVVSEMINLLCLDARLSHAR